MDVTVTLNEKMTKQPKEKKLLIMYVHDSTASMQIAAWDDEAKRIEKTLDEITEANKENYGDKPVFSLLRLFVQWDDAGTR